jgi:hypothetical protein
MSYDIWDSLSSSQAEEFHSHRQSSKQLILATRELEQRLGDFLRLASDRDEFLSRLAFCDDVISDVAYRKCASVSDSKAKLSRVLLEDWERYHNASNQSGGTWKTAEDENDDDYDTAYDLYPKDEDADKEDN